MLVWWPALLQSLVFTVTLLGQIFVRLHMNLKHENQAKRIESSQYDKRIQVNIDFQLRLKI